MGDIGDGSDRGAEAYVPGQRGSSRPAADRWREPAPAPWASPRVSAAADVRRPTPAARGRRPPPSVPASRFSRPEVALIGGQDVRRHAARTCPSTEARTDALLDGELSAGAAAALGAHLRVCPPCRAHVDALRRLLVAVGRQRTHAAPAPASLRARVRALAARWHATDATLPRVPRAAPDRTE